MNLIAETEGAVVLPAYDVELLINGDVKFAALKRDLAAAKDTIHLHYFIWEHDKLTAELTEILMERLAAGVEVRMLNDFAGNLLYKKDELKRMRAAGAQILEDVVDPRQINYRNHRKIVVIDGVLGYTGGINVGQEYIDGAPKYPAWRDSHCRFHGPAVADLQRLFAVRWYVRTQRGPLHRALLPGGLSRDRSSHPRPRSSRPVSTCRGIPLGARTWWAWQRPRSASGSSRRTSCRHPTSCPR